MTFLYLLCFGAIHWLLLAASSDAAAGADGAGDALPFLGGRTPRRAGCPPECALAGEAIAAAAVAAASTEAGASMDDAAAAAMLESVAGAATSTLDSAAGAAASCAT